ncbi:HNH endonuclease family protein [Nocardiopsis sp. FIRDI 009]|uniref:HNH endonuclease family protein n=1 Tax=Nocardiopsis sp. FIRDI 009 TaxID=714197 RepID=UPI001E407C92|nr:HNH endonuclease family protein [Nocardiopsis sp. FIRDI 009]
MPKKILTGAAGALVVVAVVALYQLGVIDLPTQGSPRPDTGASAPPADGTSAGGSPDVEEALRWLEELDVVAETDPPGYDRSLFPHWSSGVRDGCTTRQVVLLRDGEDVEVDDDCQPVSGTWYSVYDGETLTEAGDLDIDHMVPLKEAWRSGASEWTTAERERFANDLDASPQLWAVSASSNRSKSDEDPGDWLPPLESFHCDYAVSWIEVKHVWELTVDQDEAESLREVLAGC